jgi:hypothetical protein
VADDNQDKDDGGGEPASLAEELGRRAARLAKAAEPHVRRMASEAGPRLQKAGRGAAQYAREHEDEIRQAAAKIARARIRGPLGTVVDALSASASRAAGKANEALACAACAAANPAGARFCNNCGASLRPETAR